MTSQTYQFKNAAEAHQIMGAAHRAGKVAVWCPVIAFGRVTARIFKNGAWFKATVADVAALVS